MNCHDFERVVLQLARNQLMNASDREKNLAHMANCAGCAKRLNAERLLFGVLSAAASDIAMEEPSASLEDTLRTAFVQHNGSDSVGAATPLVSGRAWRGMGGTRGRLEVAAAILILVSATAVVRFYSKQSPAHVLKQEAVSDVPVSGPDQVNSEVNPVPAGDMATARPQRRGRHRILKRKSVAHEITTEFYPLMDGEEDFADLDSLVAVQIVRVELPVSALTAAGLSVGPEMSRDAVKADVVLGYDGLARAIRFVR